MLIYKINKKWTEEDIEWVKDNPSKTPTEMSEYLGRTKTAIRSFLFKHKLSFNKEHQQPWSDEDLRYLIKNYNSVTWTILIKTLHRSGFCIYKKLKQLNLQRTGKKYSKWPEKEKDELILLYNQNKSFDEISSILSRSRQSVTTQLKKYFPSRIPRSFKSISCAKSFYSSLKKAMQNQTAGSECCLCGYNLFIDLHHLDGNRANNIVNNIASLCPNHHREIEREMHKDKQLYCIWWRINPDGSITEKFNNKKELENLKEISEGV